MQRRKSEELGICHRIFNLIMNGFIARGLKQLTMGPTTVGSVNSVEVPLEGSSKNGPLEVAIELNHANGLENWVSFENLDSPVQDMGPKEGLIMHVGDDHSLKQRGEIDGIVTNTGQSKEKGKMPMVDQEKTDSQARTSRTSTENGERRGVIINGSREDRKGEKNIENSSIGSDKMKGPPRNVWHLSSVDEKSDEFIRKRKEAMRKNYSLDHPR